MVRNCASYGMTPLTREEFEAEDKRMMTELVRRRNGLPDERGGTPLNWGVYT